MASTAEDLAADVTQDQVRALLSARPVSMLTRPDMVGLYRAELAGIATEVAAFAGSGPSLVIPANLWTLAVRCVAVGTAASLEAAAFPEQQLGDAGRYEQLRAKFLAIRADLIRLNPALASTVGTGGTGTGTGGTPAYWTGMVGLT